LSLYAHCHPIITNDTQDIQPRLLDLIRQHVPLAKPFILWNTVASNRCERVINQEIVLTRRHSFPLLPSANTNRDPTTRCEVLESGLSRRYTLIHFVAFQQFQMDTQRRFTSIYLDQNLSCAPLVSEQI